MLVSSWAPRLLITEMSSPPIAGRNARRSGAGDASWADARGFRRKHRASVSPAARFKRRTFSFRVWVCQSMTTAHGPIFNACSAAHKASPERSGCTQITCDGSKPMAASASAFGICGGCISITGRLPTLEKTGANSRISPDPALDTCISVRLLVGQPPPGSWRFNETWPLSMHRVPERASCEARQSAG